VDHSEQPRIKVNTEQRCHAGQKWQPTLVFVNHLTLSNWLLLGHMHHLPDAGTPCQFVFMIN
jgi:hypothetical protein